MSFMKNQFAKNLIFLKDRNKETFASIGLRAGVSANTVSNWVEERTEPKISDVNKISQIFEIPPSDLLFTDLESVNLNNAVVVKKNAKNVNRNVDLNVNPKAQKGQILDAEQGLIDGSMVAEPRIGYGASELPKVVTVDSSGRDNISYVSVKARAGYLLGFGDPAYIEKLPAFTVPGYTHGTYRLFEVDGHSMFPTLQASDRVITRWAGISEVRDDRVYVIVTKNDGVLIKRIINRYQEGKIIAKSDNNHGGEFPALVLDLSEIIEIWYVVERWTRQLPGPGEIYKRIVNLEAELALLKHRLNQSG